MYLDGSLVLKNEKHYGELGEVLQYILSIQNCLQLINILMH